MKIKKYLTVCLISCTVLACNEEVKRVSREQQAIAEFDTLYLEKDKGILSLHRWRTIKNLNQIVKMGKMNINLNLNNVSTDVKTEYKIDSGIVIYNKKVFTIKCFVNVDQVVTPVVSGNNQLKLDTPDYLLNSPNGYLVIDYSGNFYPKEQPLAITCNINTGDTSGVLTDSDSKVKLLEKGIIEKLETDFYLDGKKWKLFSKKVLMDIEKDSIVGNVRVEFSKSK